jgi:hypothetical protein
VPELLAEAEPDSQVKYDVCVRARFAERRDDGPSELHERLRLGADVEPDLQRLALERRRGR